MDFHCLAFFGSIKSRRFMVAAPAVMEDLDEETFRNYIHASSYYFLLACLHLIRLYRYQFKAHAHISKPDSEQTRSSINISEEEK